ncbi:hypothetical protein HELRODRAFT_167584 [Helobdella robusta]|uniref:Uncharacterized protein n=1 Tax=Helobdella robusta TaxID=6412 RepID=T1EZI7_HELRO|nr:hypothetical protein HELRODRAFT_167584 [Helobdella robusta]ESO11062.1 hypothetical protein HELRODRAFT_167584 [Helobdella robusta]
MSHLKEKLNTTLEECKGNFKSAVSRRCSYDVKNRTTACPNGNNSRFWKKSEQISIPKLISERKNKPLNETAQITFLLNEMFTNIEQHSFPSCRYSQDFTERTKHTSSKGHSSFWKKSEKFKIQEIIEEKNNTSLWLKNLDKCKENVNQLINHRYNYDFTHRELPDFKQSNSWKKSERSPLSKAILEQENSEKDETTQSDSSSDEPVSEMGNYNLKSDKIVLFERVSNVASKELMYKKTTVMFEQTAEASRMSKKRQKKIVDSRQSSLMRAYEYRWFVRPSVVSSRIISVHSTNDLDRMVNLDTSREVTVKMLINEDTRASSMSRDDSLDASELDKTITFNENNRSTGLDMMDNLDTSYDEIFNQTDDLMNEGMLQNESGDSNDTLTDEPNCGRENQDVTLSLLASHNENHIANNVDPTEHSINSRRKTFKRPTASKTSNSGLGDLKMSMMFNRNADLNKSGGTRRNSMYLSKPRTVQRILPNLVVESVCVEKDMKLKSKMSQHDGINKGSKYPKMLEGEISGEVLV